MIFNEMIFKSGAHLPSYCMNLGWRDREDLLFQALSLKIFNLNFSFTQQQRRRRWWWFIPRLQRFSLKLSASLTVLNGENLRDAGVEYDYLFSRACLGHDAVCHQQKRQLHSGLAPTNCKLVFNSTSFQMDCEVGGGWGAGCRLC